MAEITFVDGIEVGHDDGAYECGGGEGIHLAFQVEEQQHESGGHHQQRAECVCLDHAVTQVLDRGIDGGIR